MIVSSVGQGKVFLLNILFGMLCVLIFDFFYVLRKKYGRNTIIINALDGIYFLLAFLLVLYAGVKFNFGALRYYQLTGLMIGGCIQYLFSPVVRKQLVKVYDVLCKIGLFAMKITIKPAIFILRLLLTPACFIENKTIKMGEKLAKRYKKVKEKGIKAKKTVKKRIKMI